MTHGVGTGARQGYTAALAGVWSGISATLARLDSIAAEPDERLDADALELLPRLQYALHRDWELAAGIEPPPGAETSHAELAASLAGARDATGEVVEALETGGPQAAAFLVPEWRGALFRVRLARRRLGGRPAHPVGRDEPPPESELRAPLASTALVLAGVAAFTVGAVIALWPLWTVGLALVAAGFLSYRT